MRFKYALVVVLATVAGCSSAKNASVSGRVMMDGEPLPGAHVTFQPIGDPEEFNSGSGSYAITQSDGTYSLKVVADGAKGAMVGRHRVEISLPDESSSGMENPTKPKVPKNKVPERYNRLSELTFDVPASGTKAANFDLQSK